MTRKKIDINKTWREVIWIEDWMWYDWIAYYENTETKQRYSRNGYEIGNDELCKPTVDWWVVCKVEQVIDWPGRFDYHYKILSTRPDNDE